MNYIGIDIGGTKCAVVLGDDKCKIIKKISFNTTSKDETLKNIFNGIASLKDTTVKSIGISCGGPLDSKKGVILSPPNLPEWDNIGIVSMLQKKFGIAAFLQNDADACALAEWKSGAGKGYNNMIFLTFGTGMGAGLILNGKLYSGGCNMAGEIGHIRLYNDGHTGYGKKGSFEGYCSGGGIAQYGFGSVKDLAYSANHGDESAIEIYREIGRNLGKGLSILIDILNPDVIVIGTIFAQSQELLKQTMYEVIEQETLEKSRNHVKIVPTMLGENIGDMAALYVAMGEV